LSGPEGLTTCFLPDPHFCVWCNASIDAENRYKDGGCRECGESLVECPRCGHWMLPDKPCGLCVEYISWYDDGQVKFPEGPSPLEPRTPGRLPLGAWVSA